MRRTLDWQPYYDVATTDIPYRDRLAAYARIAHTRFETERFHDFCDNHLGHLDEVADEYFKSDRARAAVRKKVEALYPEHEWDEFTELFWERIQEGLEQETTRRSR